MKKSEQGPDKDQQQKQAAHKNGPNEPEMNRNATDGGQGAPGIQGQYAGNNEQQDRKTDAAPDRPDPDKMNQNGSVHVALGSRRNSLKEK